MCKCYLSNSLPGLFATRHFCNALWLLVKSTSSTKRKVLLFLSLHTASCPLLYSNLYCGRAAGFHSTEYASSSFSSSMCFSCETADDVLSERLAETFLNLMLGSFLRSPLHSLLNKCGLMLDEFDMVTVWMGLYIDSFLPEIAIKVFNKKNALSNNYLNIFRCLELMMSGISVKGKKDRRFLNH